MYISDSYVPYTPLPSAVLPEPFLEERADKIREPFVVAMKHVRNTRDVLLETEEELPIDLLEVLRGSWALADHGDVKFLPGVVVALTLTVGAVAIHETRVMKETALLLRLRRLSEAVAPAPTARPRALVIDEPRVVEDVTQVRSQDFALVIPGVALAGGGEGFARKVIRVFTILITAGALVL
jgi:hypothetical protein